MPPSPRPLRALPLPPREEGAPGGGTRPKVDCMEARAGGMEGALGLEDLVDDLPAALDLEASEREDLVGLVGEGLRDREEEREGERGRREEERETEESSRRAGEEGREAESSARTSSSISTEEEEESREMEAGSSVNVVSEIVIDPFVAPALFDDGPILRLEIEFPLPLRCASVICAVPCEGSNGAKGFTFLASIGDTGELTPEDSV